MADFPIQGMVLQQPIHAAQGEEHNEEGHQAAGAYGQGEDQAEEGNGPGLGSDGEQAHRLGDEDQGSG